MFEEENQDLVHYCPASETHEKVHQVVWMAVLVHGPGVYDNPFAFLHDFVRIGLLLDFQEID